MRILVLPDIHYPATRLDVLELALSGDYDEVVLLGDAVDERGRLADLMGLVGRSAGRVTLVRGDNEERMGIGGLESYEPRRGLVLVHQAPGEGGEEGQQGARAGLLRGQALKEGRPRGGWARPRPGLLEALQGGLRRLPQPSVPLKAL